MSAHPEHSELYRDSQIFPPVQVHPITNSEVNHNLANNNFDSYQQPETMARATSYNMDGSNSESAIDPSRDRYPHSIVWTPIPCITWLFPCVGHMGIAYTNGVIRDFAGSYFVGEDDMAFGTPTRYVQLPLDRVTVLPPVTTNPAVQQDLSPTRSRAEQWDRGVYDASVEYKRHMHNICCDNCHSHVALALNSMRYGESNSWNMVCSCLLISLLVYT